MPTISKTVRGYLATHPKAAPKDIQARFNCSIAMAYRLVKENKERLAMQAAAEKIRADSAAAAQAAQQLDTPAEPAVVTITVAEPLVAAPAEVKTDAVTADMVNHPPHYTIGGIETIDFIEAKGLHKHYHLANAIKYISRAPYKGNYLEDLEKATWYLQREIQLQQAQAR